MQAVDAKVSVVIPCFNGERFIGDALKSVLSQSFKELEVIVVDDGSSDGSRDIVEKYSSDSRVVYLSHDVNKGIPAARNTGIRHAHGDYIAFLDQDDVWMQNKLTKQMQIFENDAKGEIGLVFSDLEIIQDVSGRNRSWQGKAPPGIGAKSRSEVLRSLFMHNCIPIVTAIVRRVCFEKVGLLDEEIRSGSDDYDLCFRIAMQYRLAHIAEPLVLRRIHGKNFSDVEKFYPDKLKILGKVLEAVPELADLKDRRLGVLHMQRGNYFLFAGQLDKAKKAYKSSLRHERSNVKALCGLLLSYGGPLGKRIARSWFTRRMG
ncbi:MAG: glycosyltransferase [Candidatus Latescibacterota bacterium]